MARNSARKKISIFISYAHDDWRMQRNLLTALEPIRRARTFKVEHWHDGMIRPGEAWEPSIIRNLKRADVVLLMLSPAFVDSRYCYEKELEWALDRHASGEARVIPILLRDVSWRDRKFSPYQAIPRGPRGAKPVERWRPRAKAWATICSQLKHEILEMLEGGPVTDARRLSRAMQSVSAREIRQARTKGDQIVGEFRSVMELWAARERLRKGDVVKVNGTFSEFAPLVIGYPIAKRRLHREFRRAIERSKSVAEKKSRTINACMSISAGQMVWRDRYDKERGVNCGLYESIVRNSVPVFVTRDYYESQLRDLLMKRKLDTFEASVVGRVTRPDMARFKDYMSKYKMDAFIPAPVIADLCKDPMGLLIDGQATSVEYLTNSRYLDGDIWVAGEIQGIEFFVTEFLDVGSPNDREMALLAMRDELEAYPGKPRLLGQYDEVSELEQFGFQLSDGEGPLEEIFRYGFDVRD